MKLRSRLGVAVASIASLAAVAAGSAAAADAATVHSAPGPAHTAARAGLVVCAGKVDSPHYSTGARSVIFKARIHCNGDGGSVEYSLFGWMNYASGGSPGHPALGPYERVFTSKSQTQSIPVNGGDKTFYMPAPNEAHLGKGGTYCPGINGGPAGGDRATLTGPCNGT